MAISKKKKKNCFSRDKTCLKCGCAKNLTIDHIIPKSKGGRDWNHKAYRQNAGRQTLNQRQSAPAFCPSKAGCYITHLKEKYMATKRELIKMLDEYDDDDGVVCMDEDGGWDNIIEVRKSDGGVIAIVFGGGSPFSDE